MTGDAGGRIPRNRIGGPRAALMQARGADHTSAAKASKGSTTSSCVAYAEDVSVPNLPDIVAAQEPITRIEYYQSRINGSLTACTRGATVGSWAVLQACSFIVITTPPAA
jgi:hypothetical protein